MSTSPPPFALRMMPVFLVVLMWGCIVVGLTVHNPATKAVLTARLQARPVVAAMPELPGGGTSLSQGRFFIAYYGLPGAPALGVLGSGSPDQVWPRLMRETRAFTRPGLIIQPVFEVIATVASSGPGRRGDFTSDIPNAVVRRYIDAAHRLGALVVLDVQPGRSNFNSVARRWTWALRDPWVGLALDPEWRMGKGQFPGRVIGSVNGREIDQVAKWLNDFIVANRLPQKAFLVHQFIPSMITNRTAIHGYPHLAMIQQADGFGTPREKLDSYHAIAYPKRFVEGFKLFYTWDVDRMKAGQVLAIRPRIQFVSFQ
ncbi:MAG: hypothetical protein ACTHJM_14750 [Marmoricola sp.]